MRINGDKNDGDNNDDVVDDNDGDVNVEDK